MMLLTGTAIASIWFPTEQQHKAEQQMQEQQTQEQQTQEQQQQHEN